MRRLMWFAMGVAAAMALTCYVLWDSTLACLGAAPVLVLACGLSARRDPKLRIALCVSLGLLAGFFWMAGFQHFYCQPLYAQENMVLPLSITVRDDSETTPFGAMAEGKVVLDGKTYGVRAYFQNAVALHPGDQVCGDFLLRLTLPGGSRESSYAQGRGIVLYANQRGDILVTKAEPALRDLPSRAARSVREILQRCLPKDVLPFAKAILLGDSSGLDSATERTFQISGIRHIIAVSGLHVMILYGLITHLTGKNRYLTCLIGLPVLLFFAAMAGFTPSVTRASVMAGMMMVAALLNREYDTATELSFAVLCILGTNPFAILSAGFQMSVASVAGILLLQKPIFDWVKGKLPRAVPKWITNYIAASLSVTLGATVFCAPLTAAYFGTVSLISVVTNLLTVWAVAFIFYGILAVCAVGWVWQAGGAALGLVVAWPMRYVLLVSILLSKVPMAAVYTQSIWIRLWLCLCYLLLLLFLLRRKHRGWFVPAAVAALCAAMVLSWALPRSNDCRLTVLDVGEGQCILLQSRGETFLLDCGGSSDEAAAEKAAQTLLSQSIYHLDGAVLTHYDKDHAAGLPLLLEMIPASTLYLPRTPQAEEYMAAHSELSNETIHWITRDQSLELGSGELSLFFEESGKTNNENSMAVLFRTEKCAILVTSDKNRQGERKLLYQEDLPELSVLIAGHHGSAGSTGEELLSTLRPRIVIVSAGAGNTYGHPAQETLERLNAFGCRVYRTDEQGTIIFRG